MGHGPVIAFKEVVYFVDSIPMALEWFLKAFHGTIEFESEFYCSIRAGGVSIGLHPADEKTQPGVMGQVAYWMVEKLPDAIDHFLEMGCSIYRGTIISADSESVAQLIDPFGNAIGLIEMRQ